MKAVNIRIQPFDFTNIVECNILRCVNEHIVAEIAGYILDDNEVLKLAPDDEVSIHGVDDDGSEECIFRGLIQDMSIGYEGDLKILRVRAQSRTCLLDTGVHTRAFQKNGRTYKEMIKYIVGVNSGTYAIYAKESDQTCGVRVQYRESDWDFLKRMAGELHTLVVPDCTNSHICFYFGVPEKAKRRVLAEASYRLSGGNVWEYQVESREILNLCDPVTFLGRNLLVYKVVTKLSGSELINIYYLRDKKGMWAETYQNSHIIGASLPAKVTDVKDEVVRIKIDCEYDEAGGKGKWYSFASVYSSPGGTGWYCMPEEGDRMRLYFPDELEDHAYVISAAHVDDDQGLRQKPDEKSFRTIHDKEIRFTPDKIIITNHRGNSVVLDDKKGISITSDASVKITASESVELVSEGDVSVLANTGIVLRQNENSLVISEGISQRGLSIQYR